jgi:hypothetical protein
MRLSQIFQNIEKNKKIMRDLEPSDVSSQSGSRAGTTRTYSLFFRIIILRKK